MNINDLKDWDLDIKNPTNHNKEIQFSTKELLESLGKSFEKSQLALMELQRLLIK